MHLASGQCWRCNLQASCKMKILDPSWGRRSEHPHPKSLLSQPMMDSWPQNIATSLPEALSTWIMNGWEVNAPWPCQSRMGWPLSRHAQRWHWPHTWPSTPPGYQVPAEGQRVTSDCVHPHLMLRLPGHCSRWMAVVVTEQGQEGGSESWNCMWAEALSPYPMLHRSIGFKIQNTNSWDWQIYTNMY